MGEISTFECVSCGYKTAKIRWGVGHSDQKKRFMPAHCRKCQEMVEVDLTGRDILIEKFSCGKCDSVVSFFEEGHSHRCPKCGAPKLLIHQEGYW